MTEKSAQEFRDLRALKDFLLGKQEEHTPSLEKYFRSSIPGFLRVLEKPKNSKKKDDEMSLASTGTCVVSLIRSGQWEGGPWESKGKELLSGLEKQRWTSAELPDGNIFTTAFVFEAAWTLKEKLPDGEFKKVVNNSEKFKKGRKELIDSLVAASSTENQGFVRLDVNGVSYPTSAYMTQLVYRVVKQIGGLEDFTADELQKVLVPILDRALKEIDHQLVLMKAQSKSADVFQLAYSLILATELTDFSRAVPDTKLVFNYALDRLFEQQLPDGSWPRSQPLFHYPGAGNAHCHEFEMLVQLLQCPGLADGCLRHLGELGKTAYSTKLSAFSLGPRASAWSSGHHPHLRGPESWSTASVFHFFGALDRVLAEGIRQAVFSEVGIPYTAPFQPPDVTVNTFAPNFWDCPLHFGSDVISLKEALFQRFLIGLLSETPTIATGARLEKTTPMSAILFGPPGTSKTELSKIISNCLGWPLLTVDPSYFVKQGVDRIQSRADHLFDMLANSERIVVLLDEFDEMVRERASAPEVLSRFLTTAMLPKLASINKARRIVFIVATNFIDKFDVAISRPGRFDMVLQIMPPTADAKAASTSKLKKLLDGPADAALLNSCKKRLESLTYDEFANNVAHLTESTSIDNLSTRLDSVVNGSTLASTVETDDGAKTWAAVCEEQRKKIRLPKVYSPRHSPQSRLALAPKGS
jgi:hypothetical protein